MDKLEYYWQEKIKESPLNSIYLKRIEYSLKNKNNQHSKFISLLEKEFA
jgi:hypothetical protein